MKKQYNLQWFLILLVVLFFSVSAPIQAKAKMALNVKNKTFSIAKHCMN